MFPFLPLLTPLPPSLPSPKQDPAPFGTVSPLPLPYKGTWSYHWPLQRTRLEYTFLDSEDGRREGRRGVERTLVELWRGHEEVYLFSPSDQTCELIDLWPSFEPLSPEWLRKEGEGGREGGVGAALYRGQAYDVMRSKNGSEVLVNVEIWEGGSEGGREGLSQTPAMVAYFLSAQQQQQQQPQTLARQAKGEVDVPLRLMGPVPAGEEGREGGEVRAFFFSEFSSVPPAEGLFALPSYCRNASVVVFPKKEEEGEEGGREGGREGLVHRHRRVVDLHAAFLSRRLVGGREGEEEEAEE